MRIGTAKNFIRTPQRIDDVPSIFIVFLEAFFRRYSLRPIVKNRCQDLRCGYLALVVGARTLVRNCVGAVREDPVDRFCT